MTDLLVKFDAWLTDGGPAALVMRERLMPVEGHEGVVFPATFAAGDGFPGGYNIDGPFDGRPGSENVCLIDSVGSQANRVEPEFSSEKYRNLVPQITITAGERSVHILDAGHRAGDALLRCTELADDLKAAFEGAGKGNVEPLAKIAPTSLVFGVWDSRVTQVKLPRIVSSAIRAFNVRRLTRGAVYIPPLDYAALEVFSEDDKSKAEGNRKSPLAQRGFVHNPASGSHGGVLATGGIRRDATLNLAALRLLRSGEGNSLPLRRYILGLSLVAFTHPSAFVGYLRQGCTLVLDPDAAPSPREFTLVHCDGTRESQRFVHDDALAFATTTAGAFGVGESKSVAFDKARAQRDVADKKGDRKGTRGKNAETGAKE
ncbi:MAG TPA: type I-U CRISPR-associated RAMP protein Csb1/Cas7u [Phycisphaerales bacterium]|nr:type I-U CRISPR-associated RAMP protein Csb1/Cas7u [Phycisphaerales bacterium]HMP36847.1 type I-U CRISPR-associated RAMP protein Csb1/Cas7u [Phycisphaerales bacterium]